MAGSASGRGRGRGSQGGGRRSTQEERLQKQQEKAAEKLRRQQERELAKVTLGWGWERFPRRFLEAVAIALGGNQLCAVWGVGNVSQHGSVGEQADTQGWSQH